MTVDRETIAQVKHLCFYGKQPRLFGRNNENGLIKINGKYSLYTLLHLMKTNVQSWRFITGDNPPSSSMSKREDPNFSITAVSTSPR